MAYRFYDYHSNGQCNPDGSPCQGILYRSLDLRSYADQNWLRIRQFKPGCACIIASSPIPVNFFEPHPFVALQQKAEEQGSSSTPAVTCVTTSLAARGAEQQTHNK